MRYKYRVYTLVGIVGRRKKYLDEFDNADDAAKYAANYVKEHGSLARIEVKLV